jgi:DNA-directed RNA polymerase specialized sigma24 family protein
VDINTRLKSCNRWSIYSEVIRKTPALPLHPDNSGRTPTTMEVQVADPAPAANPNKKALEKEQKDSARAMGDLLRRVIMELPEEKRLLLVCRFKHGMTASNIARLLKRRDEKQVYAELERIKSYIKQKLGAEGYQWERVQGGLEAIEGLMDEFDSIGSKSKELT